MENRLEAIFENPNRITRADIIVGMPSYNEADYIPFVTKMADQGLLKYFPGKRPLIINVDNHSPDGTKYAFLNTSTTVPKVYISSPAGVRGKGNNLRNLFRAACELHAEAVVVVDADLTSITPQWIQYLGEPLFSGFDYVAPIYDRHKYDASITNHFCYPMIRTLFGPRIRQPIGGDFGFSGKLAKAYWAEGLWSEQAGGYGIDVWMTTIAVAKKFPVCQTFLGAPKSHRVKDPAHHLKNMFKQVIWTLFDLIQALEHCWQDTGRSYPTPIFGFGLGENEKPPVPSLDTGHLYETFVNGYDRHHSDWKKIISEDNLKEIRKAKKQPKDQVYYSSQIWCRTLFDLASAYRDGIMPQKQLVDSLVPLYYSRMLCFYNKMEAVDTKECEDYIENINRVFEGEKDYFLSRWHTKKTRGTIDTRHENNQN